MARRRKMVSSKRTFIPTDYLQLFGSRIRLALQDEHVRYCSAKGKRLAFTIQRVCMKTGIPFDTMNAYLMGKRQPSILDLRDICQFCSTPMEKVMEIIPSRTELDKLWDQRVEEAKLREAEDDDPDLLETEDDTLIQFG